MVADLPAEAVVSVFRDKGGMAASRGDLLEAVEAVVDELVALTVVGEVARGIGGLGVVVGAVVVGVPGGHLVGGVVGAVVIELVGVDVVVVAVEIVVEGRPVAQDVERPLLTVFGRDQYGGVPDDAFDSRHVDCSAGEEGPVDLRLEDCEQG